MAELEHQLAQVRQERDEYEQIVQRAPALISRLTPDGRVVYTNTTCERIIGYKLEEVIGQELLPILYPGELMEPVKEYLRIAAEGGDVQDYELALRTRDGELRTLTWNSFHRFGPDGELLEVVSLGVDVTARKASEAAHQRLQEQIIAMQAAALVALSTPLIPISKGVVVMPIIGSIDEERARQIMETLLSGISRSQASTAILDITGVATVDQGVAHALLQAARAARMLGAQVVLTGIRPDVAQTLVSLGTHLEGIVTRGTLESGIAFALARERAGTKE
ncbi:PAS domain S-box protein [Sorangium sp. So ce726]|uniref:PAS domain S-box protein n=1 Tax=Sorangium sp. So ce726 TaxID=3133319 RepID=UPI003F5F20DC